ncbi:amino acid adenylation domain-containing protein [Dickeya oryzae]|uniref:Amino acid adenylation domain-containing protein n=1 Tax=Dickeya oryzae TaxID=1240404 RepID=A0ABS5BET9_9GAMM|nr:non-ribosomal peptide synthetase [Dickeya oryzae]MBP2858981.1 amino acid adenylation domain-containing protein [Dickeya oryzae]
MVITQENMLLSRKETAVAYWQHHLTGAQRTANANFVNTTESGEMAASATQENRVLVSHVGRALNSELLALVQRESTSWEVLLTAAWALLLSKYSGEDEVLFGKRFAAGEAGDACALPLRLAMDGGRTLHQWFRDIAAVFEQHRQHAGLLSDALSQGVSGFSNQPLFESLLSVRDEQHPEPENLDESVPLHLVAHTGDNLLLALHYRAGDISDADAHNILERLQQLLVSFGQGAERTVGAQSLLNSAEVERVVHEWNATQLDVALDRSLYALFAGQVAARNEATALVADDERLSYRQLAERAGLIAAGLRRVGVTKGDRIVLSMDKTPNLIAAMLGIIRLGAAYVPVALDAPSERRAFIINDANVRWTLTSRANQSDFSDDESSTLLFVEDYLHQQPQGDLRDDTAFDAIDSHTIAYVIYTSGTTGTPKGVEIAHRSLINFCAWCEHIGIFSVGQPITQFAPYTFDASAGEIFGTLTRGCELHLLSNALIQNPPALMSYMTANDIRFSAFPPPYLTHLDPALVPQGMTILTAGSAPTLGLIERWSERCRYINGYGPTETTIMSSAWMRGFEKSQDTRLSIGRPIANTRMYVVDNFGQLCAPGMAGEIWIGGEGVAVGYMNRPELTAQQFIDDPWVAGGRVYRTGDIGRWFDDGRIEFLGRRDHQIKLSGYRIELGEIESRITALEHIKDATVIGITPDGGEARLVAYVVPEAGYHSDGAITQWRDVLATQLPGYMIPAAFVVMASLPLTANGKIDRKALPLPDDNAYVQRDFEAPHAGIETVLAQLWQTILGVHQVGRQDNFFELGGHSLMAMQLQAMLREQQYYTDVPTIFAHPVLADLAQQVRDEDDASQTWVIPENQVTPETTALHPALFPLVSLSQQQIDQIVARIPGGVANIQDIYALAPLQEGILFHHLFDEVGDPYLQCGHLSFAHRETLDRYLDAIQCVIDRHDVLRTAFIWQGVETPVQVVLRHARLHVTTLNLDAQQGPVVEQLPVVDQLKAQFDPQTHRIDLTQPPLLRMAVAYDDQQARWEALMYIHHLVDDIPSLQILLSDIQAFLTGNGENLPAPVPFRHHVARLQHGRDTQQELAFFRDMLSDITEPSAPFNLRNGHLNGQRIHETRRPLAGALGERLRTQARRLGVSVSSLCHVSWAQVLSAACGNDSVVFGTVLSGRMHGENSDKIMGPCINTLPLRIDVGDVSVVDAVRQTHQRLTALIKHEHTTLSLAQQGSGIVAPTPMFSTVFNYRRNRPTDVDVLGGIEFDGVAWHGFDERTNYPISVSVDDADTGFDIGIQVVESLSGERIWGYFQQSMLSLVTALEAASAAASAATPLYELTVLPPEEHQQLLKTVNNTALAFPATTMIHQLFEQQVAQQPQALALQMGNVRLSYADLNQRANRLAHYLIAQGVVPDTRVALCTERSETMLIALLAILKAGGAYVPLDPEYPATRLAYILDDATPKVLVVDRRGREVFGEQTGHDVTVVDLERDSARWDELPGDNPEVATQHSRHLAYVIYTSGSTGKPKGVMVEHRQLVNFLTGMQALFQLGTHDCLLSVTSISFDIAGLELYLPLMTGASIVLASRTQAMDPHALLTLLQTLDITIMQATPTTWRLLVDADATPHKQLKILCGGEALPSDLATRLHAFGESLWNLYGPTETAVWSTCNRVNAGDVTQYNQSIGRPIANTQVYLLDKHGKPVPMGAIGELYIGGDGVTRGYHQRPELTAERFIPDPFSTDSAARLYRTGDFAQLMDDGRLVFLGRTDHQLKLRGHRIELGEIEARLLSHPSVREAVVVAREDMSGATRLVAYVVPGRGEKSEQEPSSRSESLDFSLFLFGAHTDALQGYHYCTEVTEFGDTHGFTAVWTPERHFHGVGGLFANPALLSASLAARTRHIQLRAGSVVMPLHDALGVAEDWSIVDNLSNGRIGIGIASGWNQRDFVLAPDHYDDRRAVMQHRIEELRTLWQGGSVSRRDHHGNHIDVQIYPAPVQKELPIWITAAGAPETFEYAGRSGAHLLTHLLTQNIEGLAQHIAIYREAREKAGFDPRTGIVTVMIHTYLGENLDEVLTQAKGPFLGYLEGHLSLLSGWLKEQNINLDTLPSEDKHRILEFAFRRYTRELSFIGTPESALSVAENLQEAGVDEVSCLIDWIVPENTLAALEHVATLKNMVQSHFSRQALRKHLQDALPDYMVPAAFVTLKALPLTPNGKIDRNALVAPDEMSFARRAYVPPQGEMEITMAAIWEELLGVERVGRQDHFFELGGYSLLAVRLIEQLRRRGLSIEIRTLFDTPVLADIAARTIELAETRL